MKKTLLIAVASVFALALSTNKIVAQNKVKTDKASMLNKDTKDVKVNKASVGNKLETIKSTNKANEVKPVNTNNNNTTKPPNNSVKAKSKKINSMKSQDTKSIDSRITKNKNLKLNDPADSGK